MILITGHLGFVGSHLWNYFSGVDCIGIDLKDGQDILTADLPDADRVYHLAAQTDAQTDNVAQDANTNIGGTLRILDRYGDKVVFASSSAIYHPVTPYAISKRAAEDYALLYGAAVVRFCNLYGPGGHGVIDRFANAERIEIRGTGEQVRTYAPVEDAVEALVTARPRTLSILGGDDMTVNQIAAIHPDKPVDYVPAAATDIMDGRQRAG